MRLAAASKGIAGRSVAQAAWAMRRPGPRRAAGRLRTTCAAAAPSDVFVLDFDGVICDSEPEVSTSAYEASAAHWPQLFGPLSADQVAAVKAGLAATRPRLVEGYEAMVMARLVLEDPNNVARILGAWEPLLGEALGRWGEEPAALKALFEQYRSARMKERHSEWVALNPLYPGVADALQDCTFPFYIASSKKASRLAVLLQEGLPRVGGLGEDSPRIFASLIPPNEKKAEALRAIMGRPLAQDPATSLHFIDDRFETLEHVAAQPDLASRWNLYFADWGYNTAEERAAVAAGALPGVRPLGLKQMCELLRWGIVSGVDDGCEPTPEEVLAGVYKPPAED